jgi:hypothetical protein
MASFAPLGPILSGGFFARMVRQMRRRLDTNPKRKRGLFCVAELRRTLASQDFSLVDVSWLFVGVSECG